MAWPAEEDEEIVNKGKLAAWFGDGERNGVSSSGSLQKIQKDLNSKSPTLNKKQHFVRTEQCLAFTEISTAVLFFLLF